MNPPCPHCNGLSHKNGVAFHRPVYKCTVCKKSWVVENKKLLPTGLPCYYCGGATKKHGFRTRVDGTKMQRYLCISPDCGKQFQENMTFTDINWYDT
jgi:transposase-like protein